MISRKRGTGYNDLKRLPFMAGTAVNRVEIAKKKPGTSPGFFVITGS